MADLYRAPIDPPAFEESQVDGRFDADTDREVTNAYLDSLRELARDNGSSDLLGEVIRFQRGDGYAEYMVWRTSPLELIWLELGDAWSVEDALIRGLRLSDVEEMVARARRLTELFGRSTSGETPDAG
jgi:hypothetical protein